MPYPTNFLRITAGGSLLESDEIFTFQFHAAIGDAPITTAQFNSLETTLPDIFDIIGDVWSNVLNRIPTAWQFEWVKMALVGSDGAYEQEPHLFVGTLVPGGSNLAYAAQLALVITLQSNKWRDPGKYNRFYVPTTGVPVDSGSRLPLDVQNAIATNWATALGAIDDVLVAEVPDLGVAVMSNTRTGSKLYAQDVRVGRVIDTQRRRRNKLDEAYITVPIGSA